MAYESSVRAGSGVSVLREGLVPGFDQTVPGMRGSNSVVVNYEDINSMIGIMQVSGISVGGTAVQLAAPGDRLRGRRKVCIQNLHATGLIYIGSNSGVTTSDGWQIIPGGFFHFCMDILDVSDIWCVSNIAAGVDVRILEIK